MLCYNFNPENGNFTSVEIMAANPLEPGKYLQPDNSTLVEPPYYNPETSTCRWNGSAWVVENIVEPEERAEPEPTEEELRQLEILTLKGKLSADDYKIIKCAEYTAAGRELPYNIKELNAARDALRAEINALEAQAASNAVE